MAAKATAPIGSVRNPLPRDEPDDHNDWENRPTLDEVDEFVRAMWYGDGGKGKTTHLASLANRGRIVYIAADPGLKARALRRQGVKIENIEVIPREQVSYQRLDDLYWELKERLEDEPASVMGLGWDSITETIAMFLRQSVAAGVTKAERLGRDRSEFDVFQEDYGFTTEQIRKLMRQYLDLPCHLGVTALSRRDSDEEGKIRVGPGTTPALQEDFVGWMDVIVNVRVEGFGDYLEYSGLCAPEGRFEAKDRYGVLPRRMVNPTFERLVDYVAEVVLADEDPLQEEARERRRRATEGA